MEEIEFRSEEVQEILETPPHWLVNSGSGILLLILLLALFFSWFIKYPDVIIAEAELTSSHPPEHLKANISGKIDNIFLNNNSNVVSGDSIALFQNEANYNDIIILKDALRDIEKSVIDGNSIETEFKPLRLGAIQSSFSQLNNNILLFNLSIKSREFEVSKRTNQKSKQLTKLQLTSLKERYQIRNNEFQLELKELSRYRQLFDKGVIAEDEIEKREINLKRSERELKQFKENIYSIENSLNSNNNEMQTSLIRNAETRLKITDQILGSLNNIRSAILNWENTYLLKSNINGTLVYTNYWNENDNVIAGDVVFSVVSNDKSEIRCRAKISPIGFGKISSGQTVHLKLDNFPSNEFGNVIGTIENISPLTNSDGDYIAEIKLNHGLVTHYDIDIPYIENMTAQAEIITDQKRLLTRLFLNLNKILDKKS